LIGGPARLASTLAIAAVAWLVAGGPAPVSHANQRDAASAPSPTRSAAPARRLTVEMRAGESLTAALTRSGVGAEEAASAAAALSDDFDTVNPHPGLPLALALEGPRLAELAFQPRSETRLRLARDPAGLLRLDRDESPPITRPRLIEGVIDGSLYLSLTGAGVSPDMAAAVERSFGGRFDLARDVESGDRFRVVLEERAGADAGGPGRPLYADIATRAGAIRLYRLGDDGGAMVADPDAGAPPGQPALLRTPVDGARITSLFGMRLHPILGFTRMHQGVDFAAPTGSPVLAAGDGVVEEARWSGGYGRWLKLRHGDGLETGYAHLSAWAAGIAPGAPVRRGQVIAYVGATGLATGPHLHYEVFRAGRRIDPKLAATLSLAGAAAADIPTLRARKAAIDATVASLNAGG